MKYEAHPYQRYAIEFIKDHSVSAVLLDMGLGKTSITLTAIDDLLFDSFDAHKVLVIGPIRVSRETWPQEAGKWEHLSDLRLSVAIGTEEERKAALKTPADIYIINRENVQWLVEKSGLPFDFDTVVIDELSSFKNHQSKRFKALMKVRPKIKRIIGLTGTPAGNSLMDLWAEFRLLDMGERLGRYISQYRNAYFVPDKRNAQIIFSYKPLPGAEEQIYKRIADITISMKSTDYLEMPEKISCEYPVYLSEEEQEKYDTMKKDLVLSLPEKEVTAANAAALSGKLCQMSNGAIYDDDKNVVCLHDRKLDAVEDIIEAAAGKPILLVYWFKHDLIRLRERLDSLKVKYDCIDSSESIKKWNNGELTVGLLQPAANGYGINLQEGGNTIVWVSLPWSLEQYQQTNARLWRQGQKSKTVVVQHIVTKGTIDERILRTLTQKGNVQDALIEAVKAEIGKENR